MPKESSKSTSSDQKLLLYGHGNSKTSKTDCEYLYLASDEIISTIFLRYNSSQGLNLIRIETSKENYTTKGVFVADDLVEKLSFDQTHQLIGFKGLGSVNALDSLGVIVIDKECDFDNPQGP